MSTFAARFDLPSLPPCACHVKVQKRASRCARTDLLGRGAVATRSSIQTKVKARRSTRRKRARVSSFIRHIRPGSSLTAGASFGDLLACKPLTGPRQLQNTTTITCDLPRHNVNLAQNGPVQSPNQHGCCESFRQRWAGRHVFTFTIVF